MPEVHKAPYTAAKLDQIHAILSSAEEQGQPHFYEIRVDGMKVVRKTENLDLFHSFIDFVDADTRSTTVVLYDGLSKRNDKYIFVHNEDEKENKALDGFDVDAKIEKAIKQNDNKHEIEGLRAKLAKADEEKKQLQDYITQLEELGEEREKRKFHLGNINIAELGSVMLEGFVRRNPQMLSKIPGGEHLAGIIEADNAEQAQPIQEQETDTEASFKKKDKGAETSKEDTALLEFLHDLKLVFNNEQLAEVMVLLDALADAPHLIQPIMKYIAEQTKSPKYDE